MRVAQPCRKKSWRICSHALSIESNSSRSFLFFTKINANLNLVRNSCSYRVHSFATCEKRIVAYRLVSAKSRGSLETVIKQEEAWWLTERTWLERTSEGTIAYSWRGGPDRRCARASETVNAQNSGGVNELGHVRSRPRPPPQLYSLYRGLVFPMGPRLISWLCESDATRAHARKSIMPNATDF